jgi:hypothetical protein
MLCDARTAVRNKRRALSFAHGPAGARASPTATNSGALTLDVGLRPGPSEAAVAPRTALIPGDVATYIGIA